MIIHYEPMLLFSVAFGSFEIRKYKTKSIAKTHKNLYLSILFTTILNICHNML